MPVLAPALLLSDAGVQRVLNLPFVTDDSVLVQDYQSIDVAIPIPINVPLDPYVEKHSGGANTEFTCTPYPGITMRSGLRLLPRSGISTVAPLAIRRNDVSVPPSGPIACSIGQLAQYLRLSGDQNPVHGDDALLADLGLRAPVVPGLLLVSLLQPSLEDASKNRPVVGLRARFAAPIFVEQKIRLAVQSRGQDRLRAFIFSDAGAHTIIDVRLGA